MRRTWIVVAFLPLYFGCSVTDGSTDQLGETDTNGSTEGLGTGGATGSTTTKTSGSGTSGGTGSATGGTTMRPDASTMSTGATTGGTTNGGGSTGATGIARRDGGADAGRTTSGSSTGGTGGRSATGSTGRGTTGSSGTTSSTGTTGRGTTGSTGGGTTGTGGSCNYNWNSYNGNGELTYYYFGQGTFKDNLGYRPACGSIGTENGQTDQVQGIASASLFGAMNTQEYRDAAACGACVQITGNGKTEVVTIADECPSSSNTVCKNAGHIDLTKAAFDPFGFNTGDPSGVTWKYVPCPVTGNIQAMFNNYSLYVFNHRHPIKSITLDGKQMTRNRQNQWKDSSQNANGTQLQITDIVGHTVTGTVDPNKKDVLQDTGVQLPACP